MHKTRLSYHQTLKAQKRDHSSYHECLFRFMMQKNDRTTTRIIKLLLEIPKTNTKTLSHMFKNMAIGFCQHTGSDTPSRGWLGRVRKLSAENEMRKVIRAQSEDGRAWTVKQPREWQIWVCEKRWSCWSCLWRTWESCPQTTVRTYMLLR